MLAALAGDVGLDVEEAARVLEERRFSDAVDRDWSRSMAAGVTMIPAFAAGQAMLLLGETLRLFHLAGIVLILSGIYIATAVRPFWRRL